MQRATKEILKNDCFDRLREELGDGFDAAMAARVSAVAGDVATDGLGLDADGPGGDCRAATSSSTRPPRSASTRRSTPPSRSTCSVRPGWPPPSWPPAQLAEADGRTGPVHYIPVSTAYVAGTHQGEAREELLDANPFTVDVDWRQRGAAPPAASAATPRPSPASPERLAGFHKAAREELGGAGLHLLAERAERLREDWVKKQMVEIGQARAQSLGWPDAYPYTKALGERALVSQFGDTVPITIIRPSIIESALAEPRPGWIRGFRMAEPIIISYARGLLREFPGVPEGVTDVIPVDLVVAAIIAVAGEALLDAGVRRPGRRLRRPVGVPRGLRASGTRSATARLVELVTAWFQEHPALRPGRPAHRGARVVVPGPGTGPAPAHPGLQGDDPGRAGGRVPPHPGQAGRVDGRPRGAAPAGRPGARLRRAVRGLHRDRGPLPGRPAPRPVGPHGRRRPGHVLPRSRRHRLDHLRPRDPPALDHRARPGPHAPRASRSRPTGPTGPGRTSSPPTATWPPSTSRTP